MTKLDAVALKLARIARRRLYSRPQWGDHCLRGIEGRVSAAQMKSDPRAERPRREVKRPAA